MADNKIQSQVYKGISSQTFITIVMGVLEISVFAIMSRLLSPADFGYYAIIIAIVGIFSCLTEAGLGSAVIQRKDATKEYVSTALGLSVILGVSFTLLLLVLAKPLSVWMGFGDGLTIPFCWMSVTLLLCSVNSVSQAMFMRTLDFMKFGLCRVAAYIISSTIGVVMAWLGYGVYAIVASAVSNAVLTTIILLVVRGERPSVRIYPNHVKEIVSYGGWLTGSIIVRKISTELDKFILTRFFAPSLIGAYNRPSGFISSISTQIISIYDIVLFPILSSFKDDETRIKSSFLKAISLISWFSTILSIAFILGAQIIIDVFFGPEWEWLITIFRILSISIVFLACTSLGDCFFRSLGLVKYYFYMRSATCVMTLVCVCIGVQYGILGVAIGILVSRLFDSIIKFAFLSSKMSVSVVEVIKSVLSPMWATVLLAIACLLAFSFIPYGEYIGIFVFGVMFILLFFYAPKIFGKDVYENIYLVLKNKIVAMRRR